MALPASNRDLKQLRRWLRDRDARRADAVFVVEGPRALASLRDRAVQPRVVFVEEPAVAPAGLADGVVAWVARGALDKVADARSSQGVIAVFDRPAPADAARAVDAARLLVVLPRVSDPGNLGTIARSAQAAGAGGIVVGPGSVDPYNPKTVRAGAGAIGSLPVWAPTEEAEVRELLDRVADRGGVRLGAAADATTAIDAADFGTEPLALVFGHETAGLAPLSLDATFSIPMAAGSESLNVAMAATIVCFEVARRRREAGR